MYPNKSNVETIFGEVMANTRKLISADRATLFLLDAENKELYSHVSKRRVIPEKVETRFSFAAIYPL